MGTKKIKKVLFSIDKGIIDKLNSISRINLPNKSELVENLLKKWLNKNKHLLK